MIPHLASPSVCVIDDEERDYVPILDALMTLGLGCVHVRGRNGDPLPPQPFDALRLVFTDLHLSGQVGKAAASHTANVVRKVVSSEYGPVLIVIWSKYAGDPAGDISLPPEDQPTEASLFKTELLNADPKFKTRLVFTEMPKPKPSDRPSDWISKLQDEIGKTLQDFDAFNVLWGWEKLAHSAGFEVSETLIKLTENNADETLSINEKLKLLLRLLSQQQGGPDNSPTTAARHLLTVFSQMGLSALELAPANTSLDRHSAWLSEQLNDDHKRKHPATKLNARLLTAPASPAFATFAPGTVYEINDIDAFSKATGFSLEKLQHDCFGGDPTFPAFTDFKSKTKPVLLEITPVCDFHQGNRRCATLLAGLICPPDVFKKANAKDACKKTPIYEDHHVTPSVEVGLVFCGRYRFTTAYDMHPVWLQPRLRLRDSLVTDIRNWHSSQASRMGYLSFH